ncbi:MAG: DUF3575 domain-containing protein [Chitinophagaceae bacterium]|nr:MAG: DUF3575 domain-containing protein [Chitinophagaceae bacterium]
MTKASLFIAGLLAAGTVSAQGTLGSTGTASTESVKTKTKIKSGKSNDRPFAVKWNPISLAFGKIGLSGEYNLNRKKSVTFGIGIPVSGNYTRDRTEERVDLSTKTFSIMGGYRMYLGKEAMRGFYFEPYLKYVNLKSNGRYDNKNVLDRDIYLADITYSGAGIGAQLGVQFAIARRVVFDLFLLGPEANISKFEGRFTDVSPDVASSTTWNSGEAERQIRDFIDDIPVVRDNVTYTVDNAAHRVTASYKGFLPGLRAGLSVGIRF